MDLWCAFLGFGEEAGSWGKADAAVVKSISATASSVETGKTELYTQDKHSMPAKSTVTRTSPLRSVQGHFQGGYWVDARLAALTPLIS